MMQKIVVLVLLLCFVSIASARDADAWWNNNTGNRKWSDSGNWDDGAGGPITAPIIGQAIIRSGILGPIVEDGVSTSAMPMASGAGTSTVDIRSGGYMDIDAYWFGQEPDNTAIMTVDAGGELKVEGRWGQALDIGNGVTGAATAILNVDGLVWSPDNGGSPFGDELRIGTAGAKGTVNVSGLFQGGGLTLGTIDLVNDAGGYLNFIDNGVLVLYGDQMARTAPGGDIFAWVLMGNILGNGAGITNLQLVKGIDAAGNTVLGVPEPATIALLGLGGLALIRRKR